jgi:hypothetical protein
VKTTTLPEQPDAKSPAGADIRLVMDGETGNMIHSTVPPHQVNRATVHADEKLGFICVSMPPWPGDAEASYVEGVWQSTV